MQSAKNGGAAPAQVSHSFPASSGTRGHATFTGAAGVPGSGREGKRRCHRCQLAALRAQASER
eukprot:457261-Pelagomonas_calceolata.AAC.1